MRTRPIFALLLVMGLFACSQPPAPTLAPAQPTTNLPATDSYPSETSVVEVALITERDALFAGSGLCAACHTNLKDADDQDVSIPTSWRTTMMANAVRDPYWQAAVRSEIERHPDYTQAIVTKCSTCHAPMYSFSAQTNGLEVAMFDSGFLAPENPNHGLAMDGVSCTLCHQIEAINLGEKAGSSGEFSIDTSLPENQRKNYGPFEIAAQQAQIMQAASGYLPLQGDHFQESELCATCHTLYTHSINTQGEISGELPEQMPYVEWLNSAFAGQQSCQECHMPAAAGGVVLSITGGDPRSPFFKHEFTGGNTEVLQMLALHGSELEVNTPSEQFQAASERARQLLQSQTASLTIDGAGLSDGVLSFQVAVHNQVGHKFPSGYPSRRVWLHTTITDGDGNLVFESGALNPDGSILGNANDEQPADYEPHYELITESSQVQIYEAIMTDSEGAVTTSLLGGMRYVKDNRLLPEGFDKSSVPLDVGVFGSAGQDASFQGGMDQVSYQVSLGEDGGSYTIRVELLYQAIAYRWAHNLAAADSAEVSRFQAYYAELPPTALVIAEAEQSAGGD